MTENIFWEIHSELPREGPGDNASTGKAFAMLAELPQAPRVLDVACGPGMQTLELVYRLVNLFRKWQDLWRLPMLCEFC
jgi:hypothetical protein